MFHTTPISTLFPYTTLFRSRRATREVVGVIDAGLELVGGLDAVALATVVGGVELEDLAGAGALGADGKLGAELLRSEEHTSELQSRENLVCRLLLEKKKKLT